MTAAILTALLLLTLVVAVVETVHTGQDRRALPRDQRWDSTDAEVAEWGGILRSMLDRDDDWSEPLSWADRMRALTEPTGELPTVRASTYRVPSRPVPLPMRWARWHTPPGGAPVLTGQGVIPA